MLKDLRWLESEFTVGPTFEYHFHFYDYEQYFVLIREFTMTFISSVVAVLLVILIITSSFHVTILVSVCIIMTDLFLAGLIYYWGLTLNHIVVI